VANHIHTTAAATTITVPVILATTIINPVTLTRTGMMTSAVAGNVDPRHPPATGKTPAHVRRSLRLKTVNPPLTAALKVSGFPRLRPERDTHV